MTTDIETKTPPRRVETYNDDVDIHTTTRDRVAIRITVEDGTVVTAWVSRKKRAHLAGELARTLVNF
jgi:uncharacterized protein YbaA (DUF1428 family)